MARERTRQAVVCMAVFFALIHFSATSGQAVESEGVQELASTMERLKSSIEAIGVTLVPTDIEGGNQYYSRYAFDYNGCAVLFSYDFTYYDRLTRQRKTARFPFSFNLQEIDSPQVAPFYLTHISNQVYTVEGNGFRIPVADAGQGERIAADLESARRLCRMGLEGN